MTVSAEDTFKVTITIAVTNNSTGEKTTETAHTDYELNYGSMQALRQVTIGALNESSGELGSTLAEGFGQVSLRQIMGRLGNMPVDPKGSGPVR